MIVSSYADSIILATAREHAATLWTQDEHFSGLPEVKYIRQVGGMLPRACLMGA